MRDPNSKKKDYKITEELKFDVRLQSVNLAYDFISKEELNKHLSALPDESANVATIELNQEPSGAKPEGLTFL